MTFKSEGQAPVMTATGAVRWPLVAHRRNRLAISVSGAGLLHVAVCAVVLTGAELAVPSDAIEEPSVTMVFASALQPAPEAATQAQAPVPPAAETAEPAASPDPPPPPARAPPLPSDPSPPAAPPPDPEPPPPPEPPLPKPVPAKPVEKPAIRHASAARPKAPARPAPARHPADARAPSSVRAGPPPPADAPAAAPADAPIPVDWQRSLAAWLAAHKTYPEEARRRGDEGTAVLRFTVDRSGRVTDARVVRGTGSAVLDAAAEAMLRSATLPAFSAGMPQQQVTVTVQIHYALRN